MSAESEGNEGGAISGGTSGAASTASGCFPSFWDPQDFDQWLNGDFTGVPLLAALAIATQMRLCMLHLTPMVLHRPLDHRAVLMLRGGMCDAETARPMDYGSLNAVGMVSVCIYTIALASLAFF